MWYMDFLPRVDSVHVRTELQLTCNASCMPILINNIMVSYHPLVSHKFSKGSETYLPWHGDGPSDKLMCSPLTIDPGIYNTKLEYNMYQKNETMCHIPRTRPIL